MCAYVCIHTHTRTSIYTRCLLDVLVHLVGNTSSRQQQCVPWRRDISNQYYLESITIMYRICMTFEEWEFQKIYKIKLFQCSYMNLKWNFLLETKAWCPLLWLGNTSKLMLFFVFSSKYPIWSKKLNVLKKKTTKKKQLF